MRTRKTVRMDLNFKKITMKNNVPPLFKLESVLVAEKTTIEVTQDLGNLTARRFVTNKAKVNTHTILLNTESSTLSWVNNRGGEWQHQFENAQQATEWWQRMILQKVVVS